MKTYQELNRVFQEHGFNDFKWMKADQIKDAQWVRFKCMFGCSQYGQRGSCPPNVPLIPECKQFFSEYKDVVVFHIPKELDNLDMRNIWGKEVNLQLLKVEREVLMAGYRKTFLLFMDKCWLCEDCPGTRLDCKIKMKSRPCPESLGVDVFSTVKSIDFPIKVLTDYHDMMNRYAFLLVD